MNVKGSDGIHANLSSTFRRKLCVLNTTIENKTKIATIFRFRRFRRLGRSFPNHASFLFIPSL